MIAPGRRLATLAFGIKLMSLDEQQRVVETMRASLHPPKGVSAQLVGLSVLAAQANAQVASPWRRLQTLLIGLAAVALVLLIAFAGDVRRALTPLTPIVLASGWSALILFIVRVPLNPMSLALGALVIAIATEFSVLLSERHRQERAAGHDVLQALVRTYRHTGAAVAASGVTAIMGFGVLVLSDISMLRDFGLVTVIDLSVSLVGVLIALPAALVLVGAHRTGRPSRPRARPVADAAAAARSDRGDGAQVRAWPAPQPDGPGRAMNPSDPSPAGLVRASPLLAMATAHLRGPGRALRTGAPLGIASASVWAVCGSARAGDPGADHGQYDSHQAERRQGHRNGPCDSAVRGAAGAGQAERRRERRDVRRRGLGRPDSGLRGTRAGGPERMRALPSTGRWSWRCSSTRVPARTCSPRCRRSRARFPR